MPTDDEGGLPRPTVLLAPDKFRGSLTGPEVVAAARAGAETIGWEVIGQPMADGGEGMLDAFGGANRTSEVTGPAGNPVRAQWRLADGVAVIESARASGLELAGGGEANDPMAATSRGTGELVA
ncbi:glycerate kinase, partial [Janibacter corallicola]|uniref:glycerate kinase n=1 Tax=Janibacter corallicola TaxID=415212 RepID=UPI000B2AF76B